MTKSRKFVPAALHAELTEYTSLLRALRTTDTLDLTSHLIKPIETEDTDLYEDDPGLDDIEHTTFSRLPSTGPNTIGTEIADLANNGSSSQDKKRKRKQKDLWTRWPLLAGDVHIPEWSLEDEVKLLASQCLKLQGSSYSAALSDGGDEFDEEEARLPPLALKNLTLASSSFLSHILALIAAHIPLAEKSMQNRFKPLDWENVLSVSAASGLVSAEMLENVQQRLESIYGAKDSNAVSRIRSLNATSDRLSEMCSSADSSLLELYVPSVTRSQPKKKKRGKYKMTGKYKRRKIAVPLAVDDAA